jgi:hypothetical protein
MRRVYWLWTGLLFLPAAYVLRMATYNLVLFFLLPILEDVLNPFRAPRTSGPWNQVHQCARAASVLFCAEVYSVPFRFPSGIEPPLRWLAPTGDPGEDFLLWCGAVVLLAFSLAQWDKARLERQQLREARDHALRLKLAPHFIFNTLNTLKAQLERDPREGSATLDRLLALFRQLLERASRPTTSLGEELAFVEAYLGIERARLGDRLRVSVDVIEPLRSLEIPTLGLQVLVENAVKHGIAPREEGGEIRIRAAIDGPSAHELRISVENPPAPGMQPGTGTGLETLRARLRRPKDLRTEVRDGRFHAEFLWKFATVGS